MPDILVRRRRGRRARAARPLRAAAAAMMSMVFALLLPLLLLLGVVSGAAAEVAAAPAAKKEVVTLFAAGEAGYHAINNPGLVRLRSGVLLAFAESRGGHGGDGDKNDVGFKRSTSSGKTWSALRSIVPNSEGATTLGNLVPVVVNRTVSEGGERVLLVFCANNSLVWQIHSDDAGLNWSAPTDITPQVKLPGEGWVATGPANGIVLSSGRVLVPIDTNMAKARITIDYQLVAGSQGRNRQCPMASLSVGVRGAEPSPLPPLHSPSGDKHVIDHPCTELTLSSLFKLQQRAYMMISDDSGRCPHLFFGRSRITHLLPQSTSMHAACLRRFAY
jgi:hypothetical protein